ncbi:MAG: ribokinase [Cellvibrionaceae bacterium]
MLRLTGAQHAIKKIMSIIVFGSINMDLVTRTPHLPAAGETLIGHSFVTVPGGKGANQAVACAKLGAETHMVGRVGGDEFGQSLIAGLQSNGALTDRVFVDQTASSGLATIAVDDVGQNNIIVIAGANGNVGQTDLMRLDELLSDPNLSQPKILLLQLEVPLSIVVQAAEMAHRAGAIVILDPAPAQELPAELYGIIDIITPNETEAALLAGFPLASVTDAESAARLFQQRGVGHVIVKMGAKGAVYADESGIHYIAALPVKAIDTVAAGDAFNGGLAEALSRGESFEDALMQALKVGAYAVTQEGAQSAMPTKADLQQFM